MATIYYIVFYNFLCKILNKIAYFMMLCLIKANYDYV